MQSRALRYSEIDLSKKSQEMNEIKQIKAEK